MWYHSIEIMEGSIFITGADGFLGRSVAGRLSARGVQPVTLARKEGADILSPRSYADSLKGCHTVVHLAALTGKRAPSDYFRVNRDGTGVLLTEAARAGVQRFIFVSSIAAKFQDQSHYPYAQSKLQAEELVRTSNIPWTIVRPTMIFGKGSPVLAGLARLASLPVIPLFGDGKVRVQPVDVGDLAEVLIAILDDEMLESCTLEIGGPEVVTMENLMQSIRVAKLGQEGKVMHLPIGPIAACLALMEPLLRPVLPFTAGQLASFRNEGAAAPDPWIERHRPGLKTIKEMLRDAA